MKKIILFCVLLLLIPVSIIAQDIPPPENWGDIIMNPQQWFTNFAAFTLLTAFVATFVNGLLKVVKKWPRQLVAWGIAIILLVVTDLLNWGYAADFPILLAIIHGLGAGLAANGVFDVPVIKAILNAIEGLLNPKRE